MARARPALTRASASVASASAMLARTCAASASMASLCNLASTCPRLTVSPTSARTSVKRNPPISAPSSASCHAAMLPLATSLTGISARCTRATVTVSAGRGVAAFLLASCALAGVASANNAMRGATRVSACVISSVDDLCMSMWHCLLGFISSID